MTIQSGDVVSIANDVLYGVFESSTVLRFAVPFSNIPQSYNSNNVSVTLTNLEIYSNGTDTTTDVSQHTISTAIRGVGKHRMVWIQVTGSFSSPQARRPAIIVPSGTSTITFT